MKKRIAFIALLAVLAMVLCACSAKDDQLGNSSAQQSGQTSPMDQSAQNQVTTQGLPANYDPASEEDDGAFNPDAAYDAFGNIIYAGATPIPIDPVDLPTATPRPDLTFTYGEYTAAKLGIKFNSAVGYEVDDTAGDTFILTEPAAAVKDNYPCVITLQVSPITSNYQHKDVKTDLSNYLKTLSDQYIEWEIWQADSRKLMGGSGYYNNYRGELPNGDIVRGRVHMAIIGNNELLTLHITCPGGFNTSYMKIYNEIRDSITEIK